MEDNDQFFDDYLEDMLTVDQISKFEKRLETDFHFRKEFEAHKLVLGAMYAQKDKKLLAQLSTEKVKVFKPWHYLSIAASISIIALFIIIYPFKKEEVLLSKGKGQKILYEVTSQALAFTSTTDSLVIQLNHIVGKDRYEFGDTLKLFLTADPSKLTINLKYFENVEKYELTIDTEKYMLENRKSGLLK